MAKTKINGTVRGKAKVTLGTALIWVAAFVNAPRYAGAFMYSDVQTVPPVLAVILDWANVTAGLSMGLLEVVSMALLMDSLRRTPFLITERRKGEKDRRIWNMRWFVTAFWGIGLIVLAPLILVPYMDARGTAQSMHSLMLVILSPNYYIYGLSAWNLFVVLAPIFVIGGASFAQVSVTHLESSESSTKVSERFPKDWRKLSAAQKNELRVLTAEQIAEKVGITVRGAENWVKDLK